MTAELFERDRDLARIGALFDAATDGTGKALLIEGEAGVGKSTLLTAATLTHSPNARILSARCGELEGEFAYGPIRQLLERELNRAPQARQARLLAGAAELALPVVMPSRTAHVRSSAEDLLALEHGLYWLLSNLADERPLVLFIDDLHWADAASLRFLVHLTRRLSGMQLALCGTVRLGERGARNTLLDTIRSEPVVETLQLRPLSEKAVFSVVSAELQSEPSSAFVHQCLTATGGNPFLLSELLQTLTTEGVEPGDLWTQRVRDVSTPGISRHVLRRLGHLSKAAVALAQAVAVLDTSATFHRAAELADLSIDEAALAADALAEAQILLPGRPLEFHHPLIRAAIYNDLPYGQRARAHKQTAQLLANDEAASENVASQLLLAEASGDEWVVQRLIESANAALARGAPEAACQYLNRSLAEPPTTAKRPEIMRTLGSAQFRMGETMAGIQRLREALELSSDAGTRASISLELASMLAIFQRVPEAVSLLERAISDLPERDPLIPSLEATLAQVAEFDISTSSMIDERFRSQAEDLEGVTPAERFLLATLSYREATRGTDAQKAIAQAQRALRGGKLFAEQSTDILCSMYAIYSLLMADRFFDAEQAIKQFMAHARSRGSLMAFNGASWLRGCLNYRLGSLEDSITDLRNALNAAMTLESTVSVNVAMLVDVLAQRGRVDEATTVMSIVDLDEDQHVGTTSILALFLLAGRSRLRVAQRDLHGGLDDLMELGRRCQQWGCANPAQFAWRSDAALVLTQLDDRAEARRLAAEEVELARAFGAPRAVATALRALAVVEGGPAGIGLLREAASVIQASPARLTKAEVSVELGAALRRANQRAEAKSYLRNGLQLAQLCQADLLVERASTELRAAGARPRAAIRTGIDALTPSERRVCEMAANGLSNPEIAQALFITRATVESHLHSAYGKLQVASRWDLARMKWRADAT